MPRYEVIVDDRWGRELVVLSWLAERAGETFIIRDLDEVDE